ncbi:MAG: phosphatidylglycerophosphatase A family protein [Acidobacteriaceae bacterium]
MRGALTKRTTKGRPSAAPATRKTKWAWAAGTFFGVGLLQPGPGTWASVEAVALWYCAARLGVYSNSGWTFTTPTKTSYIPYDGLLGFFTFLAVVLVTVIGIPAATRVARESGREDPGHVVIDEVAGQWTTLIVCHPDWLHALMALALFRLFDITKPWPIRKLEALPGGWGIMLDDLAAGLAGLVVLAVMQHWWV